MSLIVNGKTTPIPDPPTLENLLRVLAPQQPFAAARNEQFIPGTDYAGCELNEGDRIEIVHPSAGG